MNEMIGFSFHGHEVRVLDIEGTPWWVLSDICKVLDHSNSRMAAERLDADEKDVSIVYTLGGPQEMTVINESGLWSLVLTSRKPEAKLFKKWLTSEVLPAIRRTGRYVPEEQEPEPTEDWFGCFARVLALYETLGEGAASDEWSRTGLTFPMPKKAGVRMLLEATVRDRSGYDTPRAIASRHNGMLGGRPRKLETADEATRRRFRMTGREIIPSDDGEHITVVTYGCPRHVPDSPSNQG